MPVARARPTSTKARISLINSPSTTMSATFRHAKQKPTQQDLRRLMSEQKSIKSKTTNASEVSSTSSVGAKRIDSPLAKYTETGQLQCLLCKTVVRSEDVWKVHINAKTHRQNVEVAKQLAAKAPSVSHGGSTSAVVAAAVKRPAAESLASAFGVPEKRIKGILKNSTGSVPPTPAATATGSCSVPSDFFDKPSATNANNNPAASLSYYEATMQKTSIRQDLLNIHRESLMPASNSSAASAERANSTERMVVDRDQTVGATDEALPEGFFDDPIKDAKARNLEYKDPVEEEWDRFQKEIKAEADASNAIMAEDQVEATTERQIDEIDEQMRNWSRYECPE